MKENIINIEERISLARRTLYALINTGVHGSNGLNPRISYKIYQCYVIPRLLYGLEVLPLTQSQINILSKFHLDNLKRFQSLPTRVATCAVYLLLGVLPLEAELHKRQLGLLYNILISDNETMQQLAERQIAINLDNKLSYFSRVQDILDQYRLPPLGELMRNLTTKDKWKLQIKAAIHEYWSHELRNEALERSTLCYMDIVSTKISLTHKVWSSLESTVADVRKGIVKSRMITGTYLLQTNKHKFSKATVCATCKCCGLGDEDITHMLLDCAALYSQRKLFYPKVRSLTIQYLGINMWREITHSKLNIVRFLLDCTTFPMFKNEKHIMEITKASTELCYRLHLKRIHKLKGE